MVPNLRKSRPDPLAHSIAIKAIMLTRHLHRYGECFFILVHRRVAATSPTLHVKLISRVQARNSAAWPTNGNSGTSPKYTKVQQHNLVIRCRLRQCVASERSCPRGEPLPCGLSVSPVFAPSRDACESTHQKRWLRMMPEGCSTQIRLPPTLAWRLMRSHLPWTQIEVVVEQGSDMVIALGERLHPNSANGTLCTKAPCVTAAHHALKRRPEESSLHTHGAPPQS